MTGHVWWFAGVLSTATPSPSPTPGLREGLDESAISPGLAGFLAVFAIALASLVLFYSLTGKLRGVKRRGELAEAEQLPVGGALVEGMPDGGASDGGAPDGGAPRDGVPDGSEGPAEQPDRT